MSSRIAITGASGYIGERLLALALKTGWPVTVLGRRRPQGADVEFVPFDLGGNFTAASLAQCSTCIHLAADISGTSVSADAEIAAAEALLECFTAPRRFIFVSSQVASAGAPSRYGRVKWMIEERVRLRGGIIVRPGMVYGGSERGLFGQICRAGDHPVVPCPWPIPSVQPVHVDDVCIALLRLAQADSPPREVNLGAQKPIYFNAFLKAVASARRGRDVLILPIPIRPVVLGLRVLGRLLPALGRLGKRLEALITMRALDTQDSLIRLGIAPRTLAEGLDWRPARRRRFAREGYAFLRYVLGKRPSRYCVRIYVRACEALSLSPLPGRLAHGLSIRLYDPPLLRGMAASLPHARQMRRRLDIALAVGENSPVHAHLFINRDPAAAICTWLQVLALLATEALYSCVFAVPLCIAWAVSYPRVKRDN